MARKMFKENFLLYFAVKSPNKSRITTAKITSPPVWEPFALETAQ